MKNKGFLKIWLGIALPILALAAVAGFLALGAFLSAIIVLEQLRATENAMQAADLFGACEVSEWEEKCAKWLQLERFGIVAAIYDNEGNEILHSDVESYQSSGYGESGVFSRELYGRMLTAVEQAAVDGGDAQGTAGVDPFGYHYQYDRTMITTSEGIYWLCFGSVSAPWLERHDDFIMIIIFISFAVLLFTFLPSGYYYMLYRKRLEAERYYRHTAWALAHDLKTPLATISGYAQNLQENIHTEKRVYYAEAILKNIDHMSMVIEDMLELARLQNTKVKLHKETVNMYELTEEILEPLQGILEEKEVKLVINHRPINSLNDTNVDSYNYVFETNGKINNTSKEINISADRTLIKRAIGNLINNAINYTNRGENILISVKNGEYQIVNTGVSLTKEQIKNIKKPFVKGEKSRGSMAGNGIGLTIVDEIIRLHGFKWKIESIRCGGREEVRVCIYMFD